MSKVCSSRSGLAGAGTSGMSLAGQLLSGSGSNCTTTRAAAAGAFSSGEKKKKFEFQFKDLTANWCMDKELVTVFG